MSSIRDNIKLSICIPTFNRCEYLDRTLKSITDQDSFDQQVEIVVSDNCSTDSTKDVVNKYQVLYKNIIYHCNEKNILDQNFTKALSLGRGEYLKLMNDTIILKNGVLSLLLLALEKYRYEKPVLFFYNNNERHSNSTIVCTDINQFVSAASYYTGWTVNFGAWESHFDNLGNKDNCSYLQFMQIDWSLRMVKNKKCIVCFGDWVFMQELERKGGYNIFEVHIDNYLFLYNPYLNDGCLSKRVFQKEKNRLLLNFLSVWIYLLLFKKDKKYSYVKTGWKRIIWRHYKLNPLLYFVFLKETIRYVYHLVLKNDKNERIL